MLLTSYLILFRRRLIAAAALALLLVCLAHLWVAGDGFSDLGVFWHTFCGCPVDPHDLIVLLCLPTIISIVTGFILGWMTTSSNAGLGVPGQAFKASARFFLTRPVTRLRGYLLPHVGACVVLAIVPWLAIAALLAWLRLVHAPSLLHLAAIVRILPSVSRLPSDAPIGSVLTALALPRRMLAALSVGLCAYVLTASQQWLLTSPNRWLNLLAVVEMLLVFLPFWFTLLGGRAGHLFLLLPRRETPFYLPSTPAITLHFLFAAAALYGCWRILRTLDL